MQKLPAVMMLSYRRNVSIFPGSSFRIIVQDSSQLTDDFIENGIWAIP